MQVGVVLERRQSSHPWQDHSWRAHQVVPGGGLDGDWRIVGQGPGWTRYYAGNLELELHPGETEGYRQNLSCEPALVFVVLRPSEDEHEVKPFLATACPFEAQDYLDSGEETVEGLPMPHEMVAWVAAFVERHHVETPFVKRKQKPKQIGRVEDPFARKPVGCGHDRR
jgi:hypothetical protein